MPDRVTGASDRASRFGARAVAVGVVAVVLAVGVGLYYAYGRRLADNGPGRLVTIHQLALADGKPVLLLVQQVHRHGGEDADAYEGRLDVVDPVTGKRFVREAGIDAGDCLGAGPGRIWCDERGEKAPQDRVLTLRDLATLKVIAGADPSTIAPKLRRAFGFGAPATIPGDKDLGFAGPGRQALMRRTGTGPDMPVGSATYLDPSFLAEGESADFHVAPLLLPDGVHVVAHVDTLDHAVAKTLLSAVDATGASRWQVEVGRGRVMRAWRFGYKTTDLLVVALQAEESVVIAIDPRTGRIAWRYET